MPASNETALAPSPQSIGRASFGCENCREQHLRCDRVLPTCGRCWAARRECRRTGIRIRLVKKNFSKKQKWVRTPRRLVFIDESEAVGQDSSSQGSGIDDVEAGVDSPSVSEESRAPELPLLAVAASPSTPSLGPNSSPTDRFIQREATSPSCDGVAVDPLTSAEICHNRKVKGLELLEEVYSSKPTRPLLDPTEAILLRHFVRELASWLDLCDPGLSFKTTVPQRASTCTILMKAIFALSARHLSHTSGQVDALSANRYHAECSTNIRLMLKYDETISDENLFAATIILRVWEEMEVKHMGIDHQGYMLGIHRFVEGGNQFGEQYFAPGSLSAASFWIALRQEIYVAVINKGQVRIRLVQPLVNRLGSLGQADDYTWANRAVVHCAEILNFCFGGSTSSSRWHDLRNRGSQWLQNLPVSYTPIFQQEGGNEVFPEIWYHQSCHAIGVQHHLLAELFLVRFDPSLPTRASLSERIQSIVRMVCGIGLGNQWTPPSMFTACMAIAAFGDWFEDYRDQEAMLNLLKKTEKDHARPTEGVQTQLMKTWGWASESHVGPDGDG